MASIAEKFRKIRIAPTIQIGQRQNWIDYIQGYGWVWSDERSDWSITVSSGTFWGQDLTKARWRELMEQYTKENPNSYSTAVKTGTYELKYDPATNTYYYYNDLGQRIDDYSNGQNIKTDIFIGETINETPNYNFDERINDILGNPISPKVPEVGQYDSKSYFDLLTKTRKQYKAFWETNFENEKIKILEERATDIVSEESRLLNLLGIDQKAKTTDSAIINTISVLTSLFGGSTGKASGISIQTAVRFAQSQTTDKRTQLLGKDLEYINTEYEAIKTYFAENNANLNVTATSTFGNWLAKNWGWIIAAAVSFSAMIYFIRKRTKSK